MLRFLPSKSKRPWSKSNANAFPTSKTIRARSARNSKSWRDDLTAEMLADNSGWQEILAMPEQVPNEVLQPK